MHLFFRLSKKFGLRKGPLWEGKRSAVAVVNASPVGLAEPRPGRPQATGTAKAVTGGESLKVLRIYDIR